MSNSTAIATLAIIVFTGYVSFIGFRDPSLLEMYIFSPVDILRKKQYYRLITGAFLHANLIHLVFNMFSLYSFGEYIELIYGIKTLLIIYFSSILGASSLCLLMHRNHYDYKALGASGGVCGVIYASIFLLPGGGVYVWPCPFAIPAYIYAIIFLVGSFFAMRANVGNIGHDAHLGGALVALGVTLLLQPSMVSQNVSLFIIIISATIVLFGCFYLYPFLLKQGQGFNFKKPRVLFSNYKFLAEREIHIKNEEAINELLDKISRSGIQSLTKKERRTLEILSQKKNKHSSKTVPDVYQNQTK